MSNNDAAQMTETPNVRLTLANRAENILLVRQMLRGLGELTRLARSEVNDIITAATEACNNVVLHAYGQDEGPLEVEIRVDTQRLGVVVRDRGVGLEAGRRARPEGPPGIGLSVIETLAAQSEILEDGGVEVRMSFAAPDVEPIQAPGNSAPALLNQLACNELNCTVAIEAAPLALALVLLPRILGSMAAQGHFSVDAISDVKQVTNVLVSNAAESRSEPGSRSEPYIGATATVSQRTLLTRWGPLQRGAADRMLDQTPLQETACLAIPLVEPMSTAGPSELLMVRLEQRA